nr:MAG TPA: hypothetical protein [Caudoviricetes sp.]
MGSNPNLGNRWKGSILQMRRIFCTPPPSTPKLVNIEGR